MTRTGGLRQAGEFTAEKFGRRQAEFYDRMEEHLSSSQKAFNVGPTPV
jgi:hypothetical protein